MKPDHDDEDLYENKTMHGGYVVLACIVVVAGFLLSMRSCVA